MRKTALSMEEEEGPKVEEGKRSRRNLVLGGRKGGRLGCRKDVGL